MTLLDTTYRNTVETGFRRAMTPADNHVAVNLTVQCQEEKNSLQELNKDFSEYLSIVKQTEAANLALQEKLAELHKSIGFDTKGVRDAMESRLSDLRETIDKASIERSRKEIQIRSNKFKADIEKGKIFFYGNLVKDNLKKLQQLQGQKNLSIEEIVEWRKKLDQMVFEVERLKNVFNNSRVDLENYTNELDNYTANRLNLENDIQTLNDQATFNRAIHEEEMNELQNITTIEHDSHLFYRNELSNAIEGIRKDYDNLKESQKNQMITYYNTKMQKVEQNFEEDNIKIQQAKASGQTKQMNVDELKQTLSNTTKIRSDIERQNNDLVKQLNLLLHTTDTARKDSYSELETMEQKIMEFANNIQALKDALQDAFDNNVTLKSEISMYRHLLKHQEIRLRNTGTFGDGAGISGGSASYGSGGASSYMSGESVQYGSGGQASSSGYAVTGKPYTHPTGSGHSFNSGDGVMSSSTSRGMYLQSEAGSSRLSGMSSVHGTGQLDDFNSSAKYNSEIGNSDRIKTMREEQIKAHMDSISINVIDGNHQFIELLNNSYVDVDLSGYTIRQIKIDDGRSVSYKIPHNKSIGANKTIRVYSYSNGKFANDSDIVADYNIEWLPFTNVNTELFKPNNSIVANYTTREIS